MAFWAAAEPTNDGVLSGLGEVHEADTRDSLQFARACMPPRPRGARTRALDVGAGIGRVTGAVLLELCHSVELLDGCDNFVRRARADLSWAGARVERYICQPIQEFTPDAGRYDLIWIQWCIGSLKDDELVALVRKCASALAHGGLIVVKDNCVFDDTEGLIDGRYLIDEDDKTVTRSIQHTEELLCARGGLTLLARAPAELGRDDLQPVINFALVPMQRSEDSNTVGGRMRQALMFLFVVTAGVVVSLVLMRSILSQRSQ
ncbi:hypothetical protein AB1Y20_003947 [Prymnesium parvum]|uniref:Alpha N-terminal protein methyltransferase 1 n=1 Tax=Prymnesium parvum TaxID=97485 RepID=A0AB34J8C1_PRYPA